MILTGSEIKKRVECGGIVIFPFDEVNLNPNSYNLSLNNKLLKYDTPVLDSKKKNPTTELKIPVEGIVLLPGELYLGSTVEWTETPNLVPKLDGRSSIGRLGIAIHITAGFGDIGFRGNWTLEITVTKPTRIYPFMKICQISFYETSGKIESEYNGKYQNSPKVIASEIWKEL